MSRILALLVRALIGAVLVAVLVGVAPPRAGAAGPLRVLLTGDSITQGFNGDYTWRYRLAQEFRREQVPVDFVGSRHSPAVKPGWSSSQYADPNFDSDHFARGGSTLGGQVGLIGAEVAQQEPDVIVLMAGVNDIRGGASADQVDARLRAWVSAVRAAKPDTRMVVSPVLDASDPTRPALSQGIADYDRRQRETVAELSTAESPITLADTTRGWNVLQVTSDNLHPTPTGETLIAQRIAETFVHLGFLHGPVDLYRWTSWNRQPSVHVALSDQRAVLTWDWQATDGARVWVQRLGDAASFPMVRHPGGTMTTAALPSGTYDFRVQLSRGRMATPLGPVTRVLVLSPARPARVAKVVVGHARVHWTRARLATSYRVAFRVAGSTRWIARTTTRLFLPARRVAAARVWALNPAGRSSVRVAGR